MLLLTLIGTTFAQQAAQTQAPVGIWDYVNPSVVVSSLAIVLTMITMGYTMTRNRRSDLAKDLEEAKVQLQKDVDGAKKAMDDHYKQSHGRISKQVDGCEKRFEKLEVKEGGLEGRLLIMERNISRSEGADIPRRTMELERDSSSHGRAIERIGTELEGARTSLARVESAIDRISDQRGD